MDLQLQAKTALVTGASMGIGRAIAHALAHEGAHVCIAARRRALLEELAAEITAAGGAVPCILAVDLARENAAVDLARTAQAALGHVDILVNSAGGSQPAIDIHAPDSAWEEAMTLNFARLRQLTHAVLPGMMERGWGRIINITGKSEPERIIAVTPAKAAVHGWAKGLSREVGRHGVTVNCIAPGRIMSEQIRHKYTPEFRAQQSAKDIPVGRYGEPEELAVLAAFLASPLAGYITGTVIPVDGGLRRHAF